MSQYGKRKRLPPGSRHSSASVPSSTTVSSNGRSSSTRPVSRAQTPPTSEESASENETDPHSGITTAHWSPPTTKFKRKKTLHHDELEESHPSLHMRDRSRAPSPSSDEDVVSDLDPDLDSEPHTVPARLPPPRARIEVFVEIPRYNWHRASSESASSSQLEAPIETPTYPDSAHIESLKKRIYVDIPPHFTLEDDHDDNEDEDEDEDVLMSPPEAPTQPRPARRSASSTDYQVNWMRIPRTSGLSKDEISDRIYIREFFLRFRLQLWGAKADDSKLRRDMLDTLDEIVKDRLNHSEGSDDNGDEDTDDNDTAPWASKECLIIMLSALLKAISFHCDADTRYVILDVVDDYLFSDGRTSPDLAVVWKALRQMNTQLPDHIKLDKELLRTRTTTKTGVGRVKRSIVTADFVSIVSALVEQLGELWQGAPSKVICGCSEKDLFRSSVLQEAALSAQEDYDCDTMHRYLNSVVLSQRSTIGSIFSNTDFANRLLLSGFGNTHDFQPTPIGTDPGDREYWLLTPSLADRYRARNIVQNRESTSGAAMSETQRSRMHNWSEFLVVWGRNPTEQRTRPRDGVAPSEGNSDEGWWGFWRPRDITKLAQWLEATYSKTRDHEILVSKLKDYAELLKWKSKYSGHVRGKPLSSKAAGKQRAVDHETLADRKGKGNHEPYLMRSKRIAAIGSSSESE